MEIVWKNYLKHVRIFEIVSYTSTGFRNKHTFDICFKQPVIDRNTI